MAKEIKLDELELYFETFGVANEDLEINQGVYVLTENADKFIESTIRTLRTHKGNQNYRPYYDMLVSYYKLCKELNK